MGTKKIEVNHVTVGCNSAEFYIKFGDVVIFLPPTAAKRLLLELQKLPLPKDAYKRPESVSKKILKALYKSHKVTKTLISINTNRRKKLPDG